MAPSLRTSLLLVVAVTSMTPLAVLAWHQASDAAARAAVTDAVLAENAALAAATRAEAAAASGGDPLDAAGTEHAFLVTPDGAWRARGGATGTDPALVAVIGTSLSGTTLGSDPVAGGRSTLAWARVPALDASLVVATPPPARFPVAPVVLGVALPLALGALLLALVLTRRVVRPLARLEEASAALAAGDWSRPLAEEGGAEVRALARTFNAMAEDLVRQRRALESYASETRGDVDAVNFALAHELREPLRSMRTLAAAVEEDPGPDEAARTLGVLRARIAYLERVVLDLMRYDRLARARPASHPVDLGALVDEAAHEARVDVELEGLPVAVADATLVREAVAQVLKNAAEHAGGRVRVTGGVAEGKTVLRFDDDGPGVPLARREDAFHLFQRLRPDSPGTGVGLAIVRRIASLHGGDARLDEAPGGGARVELTFALDGPPSRPAVAAPVGRTF